MSRRVFCYPFSFLFSIRVLLFLILWKTHKPQATRQSCTSELFGHALSLKVSMMITVDEISRKCVIITFDDELISVNLKHLEHVNTLLGPLTSSMEAGA